MTKGSVDIPLRESLAVFYQHSVGDILSIRRLELQSLGSLRLRISRFGIFGCLMLDSKGKVLFLVQKYYQSCSSVLDQERKPLATWRIGR